MNLDRLFQLQNFLEKFPNDPFTLYSIAYEYMQQSEWQKAIEYFERLKTIDPDYVGLYYHLGKVQEQVDKVEDAFASYKTGMEVAQKKQDAKALEELQRAWQQLQDEEEWT